MFKDITIGRFIPGDSLIHKLDSRVKTIIIIAFLVLVFAAFNFAALGFLALITLFLMRLSGVKIKLYFKSLKMVLLVILLTALLNLFYATGEPIFKFGFLTITMQGIENSLFIAFRIIILIFISCVFTFTTSPNDMTFAIETLLTPLKVIKIPVGDIAMMITIALRFIPTILEETEKIINAQKARGANLEDGNIIKKAKAFIPILIPLFVSSFRRAYDLAIAMDCRCYQSGQERTRMKVNKLKKLDFIFCFATLLSALGVILCNVMF